MMKPPMLASSPAPPNAARAMCCSASPGKTWMMRLMAAGIPAAALQWRVSILSHGTKGRKE